MVPEERKRILGHHGRLTTGANRRQRREPEAAPEAHSGSDVPDRRVSGQQAGAGSRSTGLIHVLLKNR